MKNTKVSAIDIALVGMMVAMLNVFKWILSILPNIEVTTFLIVMFTLFFKKKMYLVLPAFILIEGILYGFGIWWVMYLYIWPLLALITWIFKKNDSTLLWAIIAGVFGLSYGFICSIPYFVLGAIDGGFMGGVSSAITWWITGIPFDLVHGVANFIIMLVLYRPVRKVMNLLVSNLR